ncbi:glucose 1-dehydrogenase [Bifidobacterium sp. ESL0682]|uniref:glucose 1-dehydrogenase n=1 Tax=Bifidobacterium sp. ESL0682 TaxID=2983212 RepID=UPI0023F64DA0|nr:glucose 1-dehydrogenase [Bifidobacterium sp. ESL0682]WEV42045.1 glucose 1-dehydrogenase [Bifidobacterium sp. ESL0682]
MSGRLAGKVAVITGAGSGMGAQMARLFAKEGASIVGTDINKDRLESVKEEVIQAGGKMITAIADVSKENDIQTMFDTARSEYGCFDIVVNNAGIMDNMSPVGEVTDEMWKRVFAINVDSVMYSMREAIHEFLPRKKGAILNIASVGGTNGGRAGAAYTASKHAVVGLTKNTAFMYEKEGIRVNAIAPGGIKTNIAESMKGISQFGMERQKTGMGLMPDIGSVESIAQTALFLVSDEADYVNGAVIPVDGGWTTF